MGKLSLARKIVSIFPFNIFWKLFKKIVNSNYIKKILERALSVEPLYIEKERVVEVEKTVVEERVNTVEIECRKSIAINQLEIPIKGTESYIKLPEIDFTKKISRKKKMLVILPFGGPSGFSSYLNQFLQYCRNDQIEIHVILYNRRYMLDKDDLWDEYYYLYSNNTNFDKLHYDKEGKLIPDVHEVDEWVGNDLLQFVSSLDSIYSYDFLLVNYVFLSKAFLAINKNAKKILYTHDKYSYHNSQKIELGLNTFWYSTTPEEEKKGLDRADVVVTIQENEFDFFSSLTGKKRVEVIPYLPKIVKREKSFVDSVLYVGFIGSDYQNNLFSFRDFYEEWNNLGGRQVTFVIAGKISPIIWDSYGDTHNIIYLGIVDDIDNYNDMIDISINPDRFISGFKTKCIDSIASGVPLISTYEASLGLGSQISYHNCKSIREMVRALMDLSCNREKLRKFKQQQDLFIQTFYDKYNINHLFSKLLGEKCFKAG